MSQFDRRRFLQFTALGLSSMMAPAVLSKNVEKWPSFKKRFFDGEFLHGIASGDPLSDSVIIWTRVTTPKKISSHSWFRRLRKYHRIVVGWEVATDPNFDNLVRRGATKVTRKTDYTLKVELDGLDANTTYYYRFRTRSNWSMTGTTKTLPVGDISKVKLAVMSCSNYPAGYFNAYTDAAKVPELDAVVHLGDYIYEYGAGGYATANADAIGRGFENNNDSELIKLRDYRRRYAQYRTDKGLQALHAAAPFICVWDDHEVANDTWSDGAENHDDETEGSFYKRKRKALRAYFEWMPIRPVVAKNREIIYRQFEFGSLVNLMMLDTRIVGRDQQLDYANYINLDGSFNETEFVADITDQSRTLLGGNQLDWLQSKMAYSNSQWQVLGQQVLMGRMTLPAELLLNLTNPAAALPLFSELATIKGRILAGDPTVTEVEKARVNTGLPYNLDAWDGYAAEREVVLGTARATNKNLVVLAGDTHNAWANNLTTFDGKKAGVEFATSSVTSPGLEDYLGLPAAAWPQTEAGFQLLIDNLKYMNTGDRGYMLVTFTTEHAQADWVFVDNILDESYNTIDSRARSLKVLAGSNELS